MLPIGKLNPINMVAKFIYINFICILIGFQFVCHECECTNSSTKSLESISNLETVPNGTTIATPVRPAVEARKLSDDKIESITSDSNSLNGPSDLLTDEEIKKHDFPYYNEPTTTNGYEPSYINHHHSPVHHQVTTMHMAKPLNKTTYFAAPLLTTPYSSTNSFVPSGNRLRIVHITPWTASPSSAMSQPPPSSSHELTHLPYLENQYIASFRNIKSSVMNIIYKVQDFMSYVMSLFTTGMSN